jgi:hypothetical protein
MESEAKQSSGAVWFCTTTRSRKYPTLFWRFKQPKTAATLLSQKLEASDRGTRPETILEGMIFISSRAGAFSAGWREQQASSHPETHASEKDQKMIEGMLVLCASGLRRPLEVMHDAIVAS